MHRVRAAHLAQGAQDCIASIHMLLAILNLIYYNVGVFAREIARFLKKRLCVFMAFP